MAKRVNVLMSDELYARAVELGRLASESVPATIRRVLADTPTTHARHTDDTKPKFVLPGWVSRDAWGHYEEMRRKSRKPMTEEAKKLAVKRLEKLKGEGNDPVKVLEQSVMNGWQGLFELKGGNGYGRKTAGELRQERLDRVFGDLEDSETDGDDSPPGHDGGGA